MNKVPTLTLPTSDFDQMLTMSNRRLVAVLRSAVLAPERAGRFAPHPPMNHDSYVVRHEATNISIHLYAEGKEIFCCRFVEADEY